MSTEKLSKPVAYTDADELRFHHATSDMWPVPLGFGKDVPLYSQEYVSALLAELEATRKQSQELAKQCGRLGARAAIAERKLATPVRLVDYRNSPDMHTKQYYEAIGFNQGIDACSVAVRTAGFTVTVEGDE